MTNNMPSMTNIMPSMKNKFNPQIYSNISYVTFYENTMNGLYDNIICYDHDLIARIILAKLQDVLCLSKKDELYVHLSKRPSNYTSMKILEVEIDCLKNIR